MWQIEKLIARAAVRAVITAAGRARAGQMFKAAAMPAGTRAAHPALHRAAAADPAAVQAGMEGAALERSGASQAPSPIAGIGI